MGKEQKIQWRRFAETAYVDGKKTREAGCTLTSYYSRKKKPCAFRRRESTQLIERTMESWRARIAACDGCGVGGYTYTACCWWANRGNIYAFEWRRSDDSIERHTRQWGAGERAWKRAHPVFLGGRSEDARGCGTAPCPRSFPPNIYSSFWRYIILMRNALALITVNYVS